MLHSVRASKRAAALNAIARVNSRPSISGSATFIARSRGERPRGLASHCDCSTPANTVCRIGQSAPSSTPGTRFSPGEEAAKAVALTITSGGEAGDHAAQPVDDERFAQRTHMHRRDVEAARRQRVDQRIHRLQRARDQQRAVEDDQRDGPSRDPARTYLRRAGPHDARDMESRIGDRHRIVGMSQVAADQPRRGAQKGLGLGDAALAQIVAQALARCRREGGRAIKRRIGLASIGDRGEGDAALARDAGDLVYAVRPIALAAEQHDADEPRMGDHGLDIEIDRIGMFELEQVRQPDGRCGLPQRRRRARETGQLAVRDGQHHDVARRLAEIDRLLA